MFSYSGEAELTFADGRTVSLSAVNLRESQGRGGLKEWSGTAQTATPIMADAARIKLPNGAEADVLVTNVQVSSSAPGARLTLSGSGLPPQ
ncbi:hypothetical protein [Lentzea waywayandensis]|uniref:hypothetical protein n=1 Tax=Lentzea waywayandensis TaxID=84724 RepID=UPI0011607FE3|nr:hypothetical protein [Lentzea waywayandensis]